MPFPPDFAWGVATSAYQIEGAVHEDGRGQSIWDTFCHTPGAVHNGETGDVASDHYHRWQDDVDLMADLGLRTYRFSIAWPRLFPDGGTRLNQPGVDFYARLVERLLARGITPAATLYHWDLPQALQDRYGGWTSRETAERFGHYAATAFEALGDRVPMWITLNEPWCAAFLGHQMGIHAPGLRDLATAVQVSHHLMLGHALALKAHRQLGLDSRIGIALNLYPNYPATDSQADAAAARASDGYANRWFLHPLFRGSYPQDILDLYARAGAELSVLEGGDLEAISAPIDFLGVNYYSRTVAVATDTDLGFRGAEPQPGVEVTEMGWEVVPDSLVDLLARLRSDYPPIPIYITENGAAFDDAVGPDGRVDDSRRIAFLRSHIAAAERAIAEGTDLRGYFVWSLMDNFEWAEGFSKRFGIAYTDYSTQRRIPKASADWYAGVIRANGLEG